MQDRPNNGRACKSGEQGVGGASLCLSLPGLTVFAPGEASRVEGNSAGEARREHCVSTRVNEKELDALLANAQVQHKKLGALLRETYFAPSRPAVPPVNLAKWQCLGKTLEDLHGLAFAMNAGRMAENLRPLLAEAIEQVHALRADLVAQREGTAKGESDKS
jgi:hypothetical protein